VRLHLGKSGKSVDSSLVTQLLLDRLLLGLEIDLVAMAVVQILTTVALATMLLPPLTQLHGLSRLRLIQLPLHMQDIQLLAILVDINLKELHLVLPLLLD
jgi:hypothetical protein